MPWTRKGTDMKQLEFIDYLKGGYVIKGVRQFHKGNGLYGMSFNLEKPGEIGVTIYDTDSYGGFFEVDVDKLNKLIGSVTLYEPRTWERKKLGTTKLSTLWELHVNAESAFMALSRGEGAFVGSDVRLPDGFVREI
jgi:hypothetical protein